MQKDKRHPEYPVQVQQENRTKANLKKKANLLSKDKKKNDKEKERCLGCACDVLRLRGVFTALDV
jgi:hypothetical protein